MQTLLGPNKTTTMSPTRPAVRERDAEIKRLKEENQKLSDKIDFYRRHTPITLMGYLQKWSLQSDSHRTSQYDVHSARSVGSAVVTAEFQVPRNSIDIATTMLRTAVKLPSRNVMPSTKFENARMAKIDIEHVEEHYSYVESLESTVQGQRMAIDELTEKCEVLEAGAAHYRELLADIASRFPDTISEHQKKHFGTWIGYTIDVSTIYYLKQVVKQALATNIVGKRLLAKMAKMKLALEEKKADVAAELISAIDTEAEEEIQS